MLLLLLPLTLVAEHVEPLPVLTVDVVGDMAGETAYNASLKFLNTFSEATCAMMKRAAADRSHITSKQLLRSLKLWAEDTAGEFNKVLDNAQLLGERRKKPECVDVGLTDMRQMLSASVRARTAAATRALRLVRQHVSIP